MIIANRIAARRITALPITAFRLQVYQGPFRNVFDFLIRTGLPLNADMSCDTDVIYDGQLSEAWYNEMDISDMFFALSVTGATDTGEKLNFDSYKLTKMDFSTSGVLIHSVGFAGGYTTGEFWIWSNKAGQVAIRPGGPDPSFDTVIDLIPGWNFVAATAYSETSVLRSVVIDNTTTQTTDLQIAATVQLFKKDEGIQEYAGPNGSKSVPVTKDGKHVHHGEYTNLLPYSEDFNSLTRQGLVVSSGVEPPPFVSINNADKLTEQNTSSLHGIFENNDVVIGEKWHASAYIKPSEQEWVQITFGTNGFGSDAWANFQLSGSGSVGNVGIPSINVSIEAVNNGYYLCSMSATAIGTANSGTFLLLLINNVDIPSRLPSYTGDGISGFFVFGGMSTKAGYPIEPIYIPTDGAPDTIDTAASNALNNHGLTWDLTNPDNEDLLILLDGETTGAELLPNTEFLNTTNITPTNATLSVAFVGELLMEDDGSWSRADEAFTAVIGSRYRVSCEHYPITYYKDGDLTNGSIVIGPDPLSLSTDKDDYDATLLPQSADVWNKKAASFIATGTDMLFRMMCNSTRDAIFRAPSLKAALAALGILFLDSLTIIPALAEWETSGNLNILSGDTGNAILYVDSSTGQFAMTDGTNIAYSDQAYTEDQGHDIEMHFGPEHMYLKVDGIEGAVVPFIGGFNPGARLKYALDNEDVMTVTDIKSRDRSLLPVTIRGDLLTIQGEPVYIYE